jgi:hypothetical protein
MCRFRALQNPKPSGFDEHAELCLLSEEISAFWTIPVLRSIGCFRLSLLDAESDER